MGRPITIVEHDTGRVYGEGYVFSDGRVAVELDARSSRAAALRRPPGT